MHVEIIELNRERKVNLTAYIQQVGGEFSPIKKRPAILILPGGGYQTCSDKEADPIAAGYLKAGFQTFILRYSVKEHNTWPNPLNDYEQAMELIRSTQEWYVDRDHIAVVGFSAGGHLAGCASTLSKYRPNASILVYAALTQFISDFVGQELPIPIDEVDDKTPPCFIIHTRNDSMVDVTDSLLFQQALANKKISFESHIYSFGPHGFGSGFQEWNHTPLSSKVKNWIDDSIEWLFELWGDYRGGIFEKPKCLPRVNNNDEKFLSVHMTVVYLLKQPIENMEVKEILGQIKKALKLSIPKGGVPYDVMLNHRFSELLEMLQYKNEDIVTIDNLLNKIKNIKGEKNEN